MIQTIGILILLFTFIMLWLAVVFKNLKVQFSIIIISIVLGAIFLLSERITEITSPLLGIKAAVKEALSDVKQIREIKKSIEKQNIIVDSVVNKADIAKKISEEVMKQNKLAEEKLKIIEDLLEKASRNYNEFSIQFERLKERNRIVDLADTAISNRSVTALEELESIAKDDNKMEYQIVADAELKRVKSFFATMTSIRNVQAELKGPLGSAIRDKELSTNALIRDLKQSNNWKVRARIAQILGERREKEVPSVLIELMKNDQDLEVRKEALDSFESLTNFKSKDVFGFKSAEEWWSENKSDAEKKLK